MKEKAGYVIELIAYFFQRKKNSGVADGTIRSEVMIFLFYIVFFHPKASIADVGLLIYESVEAIAVFMVAYMADITKNYLISLFDFRVETNLAVIVAG